MDQSHELAALASHVRVAYVELSEVATSLLELRRTKLAAQCFDLELQATKLHSDLINAARQGLQLPSKEDPAGSEDQSVPF